MSICTDLYQPLILRPRRIRRPECSAFEGRPRYVNFCYALNITPDAADNDVSSLLGAWTVWDLPVIVAFQDVDERGDDLLFVASADRLFILDWDRYRDEWNWEVFLPIYRRLTIGPIPGSRQEQEGREEFALSNLKRFTRFTFQLADEPVNDPTLAQYKITVQDQGAASTAPMYPPATGYRAVQRHGNAQVTARGYSFLVTLEHDANEDFPLLWWEADWDELGDRRANDAIVDVR